MTCQWNFENHQNSHSFSAHGHIPDFPRNVKDSFSATTGSFSKSLGIKSIYLSRSLHFWAFWSTTRRWYVDDISMEFLKSQKFFLFLWLWIYSGFSSECKGLYHPDYWLDFKKFGAKILLFLEISSFLNTLVNSASMVRRWHINGILKITEIRPLSPRSSIYARFSMGRKDSFSATTESISKRLDSNLFISRDLFISVLFLYWFVPFIICNVLFITPIVPFRSCLDPIHWKLELDLNTWRALIGLITRILFCFLPCQGH